MASLILEGGTFRPIFSAGVMDALLEQHLYLPYCIGVSAGISNGFSYFSQQPGRNLQILRAYRNDGRYLGFRNFFRCHSLFGLDFVFGEIPNKLIPFDTEAFLRYPGDFWVGVTNARTGLPEYLNGKQLDAQWTMARATCAIPLLFPAISLNGEAYYDGGLSDPIPIERAIADGNERHIIVLTQPKGYQKRLSRQSAATARLIKRRYPLLAPVLLNRHNVYNRKVALCEQLEAQGKALILRPDRPLDSFERDVSQLEQNYQLGYRQALARLNEIRALAR